MSKCPEMYKEICQQFVSQYFERRRWQIENNFLIFLSAEQVANIWNDWQSSPFGDQICEIARAAAEEIVDDPEGFNRGVVYEGIQDLMEQLFAPPGLYSSYSIPREFWQCPFGGMVGKALAWTRQDKLTTISDIANQYNITTNAVSMAIRDGRLNGYYDIEETNPRHASRISEQEAEKVWEKSQI